MMSQRLRFGLVGALFLGACHLMWAMLVAMGWAQPVINFIFRMHFIQPPFTIAPFDIWIALVLVAVLSVIGFAMGYILAVIWDRCLAD